MPGDAVLIHDVWPSYYLDGPGQTDSHRKLPNGGYGLPGEEGSMWLPGDVFSGTAGITVTIVSTATTGFVVEVANNSSFRPTNFIYLPNMSK